MSNPLQVLNFQFLLVTTCNQRNPIASINFACHNMQLKKPNCIIFSLSQHDIKETQFASQRTVRIPYWTSWEELLSSNLSKKLGFHLLLSLSLSLVCMWLPLLQTKLCGFRNERDEVNVGCRTYLKMTHPTNATTRNKHKTLSSLNSIYFILEQDFMSIWFTITKCTIIIIIHHHHHHHHHSKAS